MIYKYLFVWAPKYLTVYKIAGNKLFYVRCDNKIISGLELDHLGNIIKKGKFSYLLLENIENISVEITKKEYFAEQNIKFAGIFRCCMNAANIEMTNLEDCGWDLANISYFNDCPKEELIIVLNGIFDESLSRSILGP